jgi:PLP dependent protein
VVEGPTDRLAGPESLAEAVAAVRSRIRRAEQAAGRAPESVTLLAVSKTQPASRLRAAWEAGQRAFGESYLQEALAKMEALADLAIEWHFIGRLQGNKTRAVAEHFAWAHGLDDPRHARRLSDQRPAHLPPLNVCIQVNLSDEATKGGVAPAAVAGLLEQCLVLPRLRLRGLMVIPEPQPDPGQQRLPFAVLRRLRERLARPDLPLETLSMGMSGDLEAAIAEGATLVRIGTAIFGPRSYGEH